MCLQKPQVRDSVINAATAIFEHTRIIQKRVKDIEAGIGKCIAGKIRPINSIILHHSLTKDSRTVSWDAIRNWHLYHNHWADIGYHAGIELINDEYEILTGRMLTEEGAHCRGHNSMSIGICFVGNFDAGPVQKTQWDLGLKFVQSLLDLFDLGPLCVFGDRELREGKTCPGEYFDLDEFRKGLHRK